MQILEVHVLDMRGNEPAIAEWILHAGVAVPVRFIPRFAQGSCPPREERVRMLSGDERLHALEIALVHVGESAGSFCAASAILRCCSSVFRAVNRFSANCLLNNINR